MAVCHGILILALCMCFTAATATVNYADVRVRVVNAYAQHGHEMAEATSALQGLSKETMRLLEQISAQCPPRP